MTYENQGSIQQS